MGRTRDYGPRHELRDGKRVQIGLVDRYGIRDIPLRDYAVDRLTVGTHDRGADVILPESLRKRSDRLGRPDGDDARTLGRKNIRHLHNALLCPVGPVHRLTLASPTVSATQERAAPSGVDGRSH